MNARDPSLGDIERVVTAAAWEASINSAVRWGEATPTEAVLARWVLEARATREARQVRGEDDPGEAAREQARTPGNAHRRRVLNALLAAWDAHPEWRLGQLVVNADAHRVAPDPDTYFRSDADLLEGLRALVKG